MRRTEQQTYVLPLLQQCLESSIATHQEILGQNLTPVLMDVLMVRVLRILIQLLTLHLNAPQTQVVAIKKYAQMEYVRVLIAQVTLNALVVKNVLVIDVLDVVTGLMVAPVEFLKHLIPFASYFIWEDIK